MRKIVSELSASFTELERRYQRINYWHTENSVSYGFGAEIALIYFLLYSFSTCKVINRIVTFGVNSLALILIRCRLVL